jgi:glycine dehydrogenase subunit 1
MLREVGVERAEDLFADLAGVRLKDPLRLPSPVKSEYELARHARAVLSKNMTCQDHLSFLGGGTWQHYIPAICDEINSRGEFLTAYTGDTYEDHGRWQALFEYASLLGELLEMDMVNVPTYDYAQAAATSLMMAGRITGRSEVVIHGTVMPERLEVIKGYLSDSMVIAGRISDHTAAVYFENPSYLGPLVLSGKELVADAHLHGALAVVGVNPMSLGVLAPPSTWGADIVCGDLQPLGIHMNYGGGLSGFIASADEPRFVMQYPSRLAGITRTAKPGEYGFGEVAFERTSFIERENGKEYVGTGTSLWAITAGVYLALMGPEGMKEIGTGIMQRSRYAMKEIAVIPGVSVPHLSEPHFCDFVVDFSRTKKSVAQVNGALLEKGIFGGHDLGGGAALYSVTEVHTKADIDRLVCALKEVCR